MLPRSIIERAYELAESGQAPDLVTLKSKLNSEGYTQVDAHLESRTIRAALRLRMVASRHAGDDAVLPAADAASG